MATSDLRAAKAKELHRKAQQYTQRAAEARDTRDDLVRSLRAEDPKKWTFSALSRAIGFSAELAQRIVHSQPPRRR